MPSRSIDFDLLLERTGERYRARVQASPAGEASADLDPGWPDAEIERLLAELGWPGELQHRPRTPARGLQARELGESLFRHLFVGKIAECWRVSLDRVRAKGEKLRLRLRLTDVPELALLPWEFLHDPDGDGFIAVSPDTPMVRYLDVEEKLLSAADSPQLRVLLFAGHSRRPGLETERESEEIAEALAELEAAGRIVVDRMRASSLSELDARLRTGGPYHVFHFIGHGVFEHELDGGALVLEGEEGGEQRVGGERLGALLRAHPSLRLVVLNTCDGARSGSGETFAGPAQSLVRRGVPAVLAMQCEISDRAAVLFARHFYAALAAGEAVESAAVAARRRLYFEGHEVEWATPTLYLRAADGHLFELPDAPVPPPPRSRRRGGAPWRRPRVVGPIAAILVFAAIAGLAGTGFDTRAWLLREWPASVAYFNPPECPSPPGLGMAFVLIEDGAVLADPLDPEGEMRTLKLEQPLCVGVFELTREQWQTVMVDPEEREELEDGDWPQTYVSWERVQDFLEALNREEAGNPYRLPTGEEWEYAARAESKTLYSFGSDPEELYRYGNFRASKQILDEDRRERAAPVGSFQPNAWGLYDMHGNVWEWVEDRAPELSDKGEVERMRRGCSFASLPEKCVTSYVDYLRQPAEHQDVGFRLVREPVEPTQ